MEFDYVCILESTKALHAELVSHEAISEQEEDDDNLNLQVEVQKMREERKKQNDVFNKQIDALRLEEDQPRKKRKIAALLQEAVNNLDEQKGDEAITSSTTLRQINESEAATNININVDSKEEDDDEDVDPWIQNKRFHEGTNH